METGEAAGVRAATGVEGGVREAAAGVGEAGGVGGKAGEEGSPPLTSGNLMQLQLASLSPTGEGCPAGGVDASGGSGSRGCGEVVGSVVVGGGVDVVAGAVSPHGREGVTPGSTAAAAAVAVAAAAPGAAAVAEQQPGTLSPASSGVCTPSIRAATSAGGSTETLAEGGGGASDGGGSGGGGGATASPPTAKPGAAAAVVEFSSGAGEGSPALMMSGDELGAQAEAPPPEAAVVGGGRAAGGGGGSTPSVTAGGTHVGSGERGRRGTLRSDASTDDGTTTSAATHPHYAHWEDFTNNDIVDQVCMYDIVCMYVKLTYLYVVYIHTTYYTYVPGAYFVLCTIK